MIVPGSAFAQVIYPVAGRYLASGWGRIAPPGAINPGSAHAAGVFAGDAIPSAGRIWCRTLISIPGASAPYWPTWYDVPTRGLDQQHFPSRSRRCQRQAGFAPTPITPTVPSAPTPPPELHARPDADGAPQPPAVRLAGKELDAEHPAVGSGITRFAARSVVHDDREGHMA